MSRLPNSNGLRSIVPTCFWSWPKSNCFWILSSEMAGKTLWKQTKRPHHSCEGLRLTSSWLLRRSLHENRTIPGGARYSPYFPQPFFLRAKMERLKMKPWCFWLVLCLHRPIKRALLWKLEPPYCWCSTSSAHAQHCQSSRPEGLAPTSNNLVGSVSTHQASKGSWE